MSQSTAASSTEAATTDAETSASEIANGAAPADPDTTDLLTLDAPQYLQMSGDVQLFDQIFSAVGTVTDKARLGIGDSGGSFSSFDAVTGTLGVDVGRALIEKHGCHNEDPHWGEQNPDAETTTVREQEHELEQRVSEYIRDLPFLWVDVPGKPGPECDRAGTLIKGNQSTRSPLVGAQSGSEEPDEIRREEPDRQSFARRHR